MRTLRALVGLLTAGLFFVATVSIASAHDPIFVEDDQTTPETGPYLPDGTISWAMYGRVLEPGDTRGFEFDLKEGDELYMSLLIPNLEPEIGLSESELPTLTVTTPSGEERELVPDMREVFDEPFSRTSYLTLLEVREPGEAGRYKAVVVGHAPARFSAVIGENEVFFTESERSGDRPTSFPEISAPLQAWYTTPPGGEPGSQASSDSGDAGEIQMDLIDDAVDSDEVATAEGGNDTAEGGENTAEGGNESAEGGNDTAEGGKNTAEGGENTAEGGDDKTDETDTATTGAGNKTAEGGDNETADESAAGGDESAAGGDSSAESDGPGSPLGIIAALWIVAMGGMAYFVNRSRKKKS